MNVTADALRKLHQIHRDLTDMRENMARGPKQLAAANVNLDRLTQAFDTNQEILTQARVQSDQKQLQLKASEDRIEDMKRKRNECSTNKEYQTLIEQIAADEMATSVLSDEILECMENIDVLHNATTESKDQVDKTAAEIQKLQNKISEKHKGLEEEVARLLNELAFAEKELPGDFKTDYERVVKARGDDALTTVESNMCGGCYQMITPQMSNELHMARPVFCKSCGRMLYLAADEG